MLLLGPAVVLLVLLAFLLGQRERNNTRAAKSGRRARMKAMGGVATRAALTTLLHTFYNTLWRSQDCFVGAVLRELTNAEFGNAAWGAYFNIPSFTTCYVYCA